MIDAFLKVANQLGVPTAILCFLMVLGLAFVRGPLTRFVDLLAKPIVQLVQTAIDFVARASAQLGALPGQIELEAERTRGHVTEKIAELRSELAPAPQPTAPPPAPPPAASQAMPPAEAQRPSTLPLHPVWAPASTPAPGVTAVEASPSAPSPGGSSASSMAPLPSSPAPATRRDKPRAPLATLPSAESAVSVHAAPPSAAA